jgi:hypothetical protein
MSISWQDVVAAGVVWAAVGYLGYRGWLMAIQRGSGACGCGDACNSMSSVDCRVSGGTSPPRADTSLPLVQIKPLADDQT